MFTVTHNNVWLLTELVDYTKLTSNDSSPHAIPKLPF